MTHSHRPLALPIILALCAVACEVDPVDLDAELEFLDEDLDAPEFDQPLDQTGPSDFEAPAAHEETTSLPCTLSVPSVILADATTKRGVARLYVNGNLPPHDKYHFETTITSTPYLHSWWILPDLAAYWPSVYYSTPLNPSYVTHSAHDGAGYDLGLQAPTYAQPGATYSLDIEFHDYQGKMCSKAVTLWIPPNCPDPSWWYDNNDLPNPNFDGANCWVKQFPVGTQPFIYNNGWYVEPVNGNQCPIGNWDNVNCFIGRPPVGHTAFIYNHSMYYTP